MPKYYDFGTWVEQEDLVAKKSFIFMLTVVVLAIAVPPIFSQAKDDAKNRKLVIMPGNLGNPYFEVCRDGALQAGKELGVNIIYQGSPEPVAEQQIEVIGTLIAQGVSGMAISATDPEALVPITKKAMRAGIKIVSYDTSIAPGGRMIDVMPATNEVIGRSLGRIMANLIDKKGKVAILSATSTFFATNEWVRFSQDELKKYPGITMVSVVYGEDLSDKSYREAIGLMKSFPDLRGIISPTSVGVVAAAKAIEDKGMKGKIELTGLGLPSEMKEYIKEGICRQLTLWDPRDLGYASIYAVYRLISGENAGKKGEKIDLGKLGKVPVGEDGQVYMTENLPIFDASNIEKWAAIF
jgi:rhamnose transport system substrate-binding protein